MKSGTSRSRIILLIVAGWTLYALFFACQSYVSGRYLGRPVSLVGSVVSWFTCAVIWMAVTPVVYRLARSFPFEKGKLPVTISVHLLAGSLISLATLGIYTFVWLKITGMTASLFDIWGMRLVADFHFYLLLYFVLVGLYHVYNYYSRFREQERRTMQLEVEAAQLETQLAQAQLDALKMQIHPHFLFNTLNSISVLMLDDPRAANEMLLRLSELLRTTLRNEATQVVPLRQELDFLRDYLAIEQTRFQDRLTVRFDIDDETLDASVPNLILQPLVENAIRHGIAHRAQDGVVEIRAKRNRSFVDLSVMDNGNGSPSAHSAGIGLKNSRDRLAKLYGENHKFEVINGDGNGFRVNIQIPYTENGQEDSRTDRR